MCRPEGPAPAATLRSSPLLRVNPFPPQTLRYLHADLANPDRIVLPVRFLHREIDRLRPPAAVGRTRGDGVRAGRQSVDVERPERPGERIPLRLESGGP